MFQIIGIFISYLKIIFSNFVFLFLVLYYVIKHAQIPPLIIKNLIV